METLDFISFMNDVVTSLNLSNNQESPQETFCTKQYNQITNSWTYMIFNSQIWTTIFHPIFRIHNRYIWVWHKYKSCRYMYKLAITYLLIVNKVLENKICIKYETLPTLEIYFITYLREGCVSNSSQKDQVFLFWFWRTTG